MKILKISISGVNKPRPKITRFRNVHGWVLTHGQEGRGRWMIRIPLAVRSFPVKVPRKPQLLPWQNEEKTLIKCNKHGESIGQIFFNMPWDRYKDKKAKRTPDGYGICYRCRQEWENEINMIKPPSLEGVALLPLGKRDPRGNDLYLIVEEKNAPKNAIKEGQLILWSLNPGYRGHAQYKIKGKAKEIARGYEAQGDAGRMGGAPCPVVHVTGPCILQWRRTGRLYGSPAEWVAVYDGMSWTVSPEDDCVLEDAALTF